MIQYKQVMGTNIMTQAMDTSKGLDGISVGEQCLMRFRDQFFLAEIVDLQSVMVQIRLPMENIPLQGMRAELVLHRAQGLMVYTAEVVGVPKSAGDPVLLKCLPHGKRLTHRSHWRVPGEFAVQLSKSATEDTHWAGVDDISAGGICVHTGVSMLLGDAITVTFRLPDTLSEYVLASRVVYISEEILDEEGRRIVGLQFSPVDESIKQALHNYVHRRIRELYPEDFVSIFVADK